MNTRLLEPTLVGALALSLTLGPASVADAARKPPRNLTTVLTPPYAGTFATTSSNCESTIAVDDSCSDTVTADPATGRTHSVIDIHNSNSRILKSTATRAYADSALRVLYTTTAARSSITVDALVHVDDATSSFAQPEHIWSGGVSELTNEIWGRFGGTPFGRATITQVVVDNPTMTSGFDQVRDRDYHFVFTVTAPGGIPAGTYSLELEFESDVTAETNGDFDQTFDATVLSVTVTER